MTLRKDPSQADASALVGFLYLRRAALLEATEAFQKALDLRPDSAPARLGLGMTWVQRGFPLKASKEFEKLLEDRSLGHKARAQWVYSLVLQGKDDEAFREARETAGRFPHVAEYHSLLGFLHQVRGNPKESLHEYKRSLELEPGNLSTYFSLISSSKLNGDWSSVLEWTEHALALDDNHPLLYEEMSNALQKMGRESEAKAAREEAEHTFEAEILYTRATAARVARKKREAEALLRQCVQTSPRFSKAWADLGEILRQDERFPEADQAFLMALETNPDNPVAHLGLASSLQAQGKEAEAFSAYRRALSRGLATPDIYAGLASAYLNQGRAREAATEMLRAIRELPDEPALLSYLGHLYEKSGNPTDAESSFSQALRLDPHDINALLGRGYTALGAGNAAAAIDAFSHAAEIGLSKPEAWKGLSQAHRMAGHDPAAESAARECLARNPGEEECREMLASLLLKAESYQESAEHYQNLLRNGRASKSIFDGLAFSLLKLGDHAQAIALFESSLRRYGPDFLIYSNLGYLHRCGGNLNASIANYRRARDLSPKNPDRNHDFAFALYLAQDYNAAIEPFQAALRLKPHWGIAHYNLAMTYWNLRQYGLALSHARAAQERGVREAGPMVRALTAQLALSLPRTVSVYRR